MTFASIEYLIFLPVVFLLYWIVCRKNKNLQNGLIVLASLFFYGFWDWRFLGLLLVTAFSTFFAGLWMNQTHDNDDDNQEEADGRLTESQRLMLEDILAPQGCSPLQVEVSCPPEHSADAVGKPLEVPPLFRHQRLCHDVAIHLWAFL